MSQVYLQNTIFFFYFWVNIHCAQQISDPIATLPKKESLSKEIPEEIQSPTRQTVKSHCNPFNTPHIDTTCLDFFLLNTSLKKKKPPANLMLNYITLIPSLPFTPIKRLGHLYFLPLAYIPDPDLPDNHEAPMPKSNFLHRVCNHSPLTKRKYPNPRKRTIQIGLRESQPNFGIPPL